MRYDKTIEEKWNAEWLRSGANKFKDDKEKPLFVLDTPPPYTSGVLHMGHTLDFSYLDFIARYKRMKGFNVLYAQGWDTMGFPTERAVEKKYGKHLSTEEFIKKCEETATANLTAMREQMKTMGFSMDLSREYITMSKEYQAKVQLSVLLMHQKGYVYKGEHAVYWCTYCETAIAREEIEDREEKGKLNYIEFEVAGSDEPLKIATTRPEMLHACVAVAVNPNDEKHKHLIGKKVKTPIFNKEVEIIGDESVEMEFGTGAEMVCTFGDKEDLIMFHKHGLNEIKAIDEKGKLLNAGKYTDLNAVDARSAIISDLKENGKILKQEETLHSVKVHDRCSKPIELISSQQWFMRTKEFADTIKEQSAKIKWYPDFTQKYLIDWANYIEWDWVISRDRKFDTPLPFWSCEKCGNVVTPKADIKSLPVDPRIQKPPVDTCPKCEGKLKGEKFTCDVWVDSSITPLVIAGWPENEEFMQRAFPSSMRINAVEIIRTWDFYTIYRIWALTGKIPWTDIFVHGLILGPDGHKMSKSIGNVVSPQDLINRYNVDSIRIWASLVGAAFGDKPLLDNDVKYANSFINKMFNSYAFVEKALEGYDGKKPSKNSLGAFDKWLLSRLNSLIEKADKWYEAFEFFNATNGIIDFYWHDFCDFYIEEIKHVVYGDNKPRKHAVQYVLAQVMENSVKLLAPIMPHASEELFSKFNKESVHAQAFPMPDKALIDKNAEADGALLNEVIRSVRREKTKGSLALNYKLPKIVINIPEDKYSLLEANKTELSAICKVDEIVLNKGAELAVELKL